MNKKGETILKRDQALPLTPEEILIIKTETKLSATSLEKFRSFCGYHLQDFRTRDAEGTRGGLLTAWNSSPFDCIQEWKGAFTLTVLLKRKIDGATFMISNVYGPTSVTLKANFFQELRSIYSYSTGIWTLLGDFNVLLSVNDKNGATTHITDILNFREVVHDLQLVDLPILNKAFTWTNGRGVPTLERQDRAFISTNWVLAFPRSTLCALPRPRSDHTPLVLSAFTFIPSADLFRFESFWLRHPAVFDVVSTAWNSTTSATTPVNQFASKLKSVQTALRIWSVGLSSRLQRQANLCLLWIDWLDNAEEHRALTNLERALRPKLKVRYDELCLQEEIKWKQRSRVHWLKVGDANTRFFLLKATGRRNSNFISRLSNGCTLLSSHQPIADHLFSFFSNQLGDDPGSTLSINLLELYRGLNPDLSCLQEDFTAAEVRKAVFSSGPEKAPGPDGLPMLFYQRFWTLLNNDIMSVFNSFHNGSAKLSEINASWLCLIPKKSDALLAKDFRPISLLINPHQAAFIKGRNLFDNFSTAHVLVHHYYASKQSAALLKIDFERAFDHINWDFLIDLLRARGFAPTWISWIQEILKSVNTSVILNGVPGNSFTCKRGLRQGDPLSPLLFILCVDVLFRMFQRATSSDLLQDPGIGEVRVQALQFADDLLIFLDGSPRAAAATKLILDDFAACSGLRINYDKSSLTPINLSEAQATSLASSFGCTVKAFPICYLGLPLSPTRLTRSDYMPLIEKIDNRLAGWKGLNLSRGGRLVLLNSARCNVEGDKRNGLTSALLRHVGRFGKNETGAYSKTDPPERTRRQIEFIAWFISGHRCSQEDGYYLPFRYKLNAVPVLCSAESNPRAA
uniref:Reverse transcriptase domain-containing protein n=1 Tax=Ananas comosus var. bracteatus TaxID=296719 RepID=A0A6V7PH86_ANACO|nr:unnamed protein product [Ananas comosus var. bracteatus]